MNKLKSENIALLENYGYYQMVALLRIMYFDNPENYKEEIKEILSKIGELPLTSVEKINKNDNN